MTESHRETNSQLHRPVCGGAWRGRILPMIILVFVTLAVFRPVISHQFLAYDDSVNIYGNPYFQTRSLDNLLHFWRYPYEVLYAPLTYTLWALTAWAPAMLTAEPSAAVAPDPRLFHSLNLLLHLLSVLIVWRILEPALTSQEANGDRERLLTAPHCPWNGRPVAAPCCLPYTPFKLSPSPGPQVLRMCCSGCYPLWPCGIT